MPISPYIPLVEVTRGPIVECVHYGAFAICDIAGRVLYSGGKPDLVTFLRSATKPFQALPLVEGGGMQRFTLDEKELAVMCASHHGTDEHVSVVAGIQAKLGFGPQDLLCGMHPPEDPATAQRMLVNNEPTSSLRHNCSGKHSGMLAQCLLRGLPTEDYINPAHPVQQAILQVVAEMTSVPTAEILLGTDGCSAPVFALPLKNAALAFSRLADPTGLPEVRQSALRLVFHAMTTHPEMVAGPEGFDTSLMAVGRGKILTKVGAEGFQAVALLPGACGLNSPAMGIALKISDGDRLYRARTTAIVSLLRQLGALDETQVRELAEFIDRPQFNWRRMQVGEIRSIVKL